MKQLIADEQGRVEGLEALYPPGAIVYVDAAGHVGGYVAPSVEGERAELVAHAPVPPFPQLQEKAI